MAGTIPETGSPQPVSIMVIPLASPGCIIISGATMTGKSVFTQKLIEGRQEMFSIPPVRVYYAYKAYQAKFQQMEGYVQFHEGLPTSETVQQWGSTGEHILLVLDDLGNEASNSPEVLDLFQVFAHHLCISVIYILQNVFPPGKFSRSISLNASYLIIFGSRRDENQVATLGRQIYPTQGKFFMKAYKDAVSVRWGYLLVDLHPSSSRDYQLRTNILPGQYTYIYKPM